MVNNKKFGVEPNLFGNYSELQVDAIIAQVVAEELIKKQKIIFENAKLIGENSKLKTRIWRAKDRVKKGQDLRKIIDTLNGKTKRGRNGYFNPLIIRKVCTVSKEDLLNVMSIENLNFIVIDGIKINLE